VPLNHDAIQRLSRDWSSRLIMACMPFLFVSIGAFVWVFRESARPAFLAVWVCVSVLSCGATYLVTRRYLAERISGGDSYLWDLRQPPALAMVALAWGASPYVLDPGAVEARTHTAALLFPLAVSVLLAVITAPVRRLLVATLPFLLAPACLWLIFNEDRVLQRMSLAAVGFAVLLLLMFRTVHQMMRSTVELSLRNEVLLDQLQQDRSDAHRSNELLAEANQRLLYQATHDPLTGVLNRRGLLDQLDSQLSSTGPLREPLIILFCDLDRFKIVNDSLGHAAGDQLLAVISARLSEAFPQPHQLARLGGDEFVLLCAPGRHEDAATSARRHADRVRSVIAEPVEIEDHLLVVTSSVGVAIGPEHGVTSRDLLRHADAALHRAKDAGRDRFQVFDESFQAAHAHRVDEEQTIRAGLDNGDFVPWYQPIVDARTGTVVGAELLVRWLNGSGPPQTAASFIDLVSESGLVERLSEQVIEQGLRDLAQWEAHGLPHEFRLSVNLPPRYMSRTGRVGRITELLVNGPCHRLTVEVTESSVVEDVQFAERQLSELRARGLTVALDDFGTGSASLTLLQRLPLDSVKIDRSFVAEMASDERDRALVRGFISLARDLHLDVTAEGIERPATTAAPTRLSSPTGLPPRRGDGLRVVRHDVGSRTC
jgi:diguanylate cyclase (GGDEF)-like protein